MKTRPRTAFLGTSSRFAPLEDEITSLEKAFGHFKTDLATLKKTDMVKRAKKGHAFEWPARHSDPITVSPCCKRCGADAHREANTLCAFAREEQKLTPAGGRQGRGG